MITEFASQYEMRGQMADFSDIIRDSLAHRSNMMLQSKMSNFKMNHMSNADKAALFYNDWEDDKPSNWPEWVKKRQGAPYAFHKRAGQWVPVHSAFGFLPDISEWISENATNSISDREEFVNKWINASRHIRLNTPYSYQPKPLPSEYKPSSIIVRNISNHISDADLMMAFSAFGHIIDFYHPDHNIAKTSRKKKAFYAFIEFYNEDAVNNLMNDFNGILYFMDTPITIQRAGTRKSSDYMKTKFD